MVTTDGNDSRRRIMDGFGVNKKHRQPDWNLWQGISNAPIWKVVALSCDIDPYELEGWHESPPVRIAPKRFIDRLEQVIAALAINGGPLVSKRRGPIPAMYRVELGDFRAWAVGKGISLPHQFPIFEVCNPLDESDDEKQLRLTREIAHERSIGTPNFMEKVASRVFNEKTKRRGISTARLKAIVGTVPEQANRLASDRKAHPDNYPTSILIAK